MTERPQIKFGLIRTDEQFQSLIRFAASFDHHVGPDSIIPIYTIDRGDQMIGYFNVMLYPVVFPAFHPALCTPRDFHEAVQLAKTHFCMNSIDAKFPNGTCFLALPIELSVRKELVEKMGFQKMKKELWQAIPK